MKTNKLKLSELLTIWLSVVILLFWLYAAGSKLYDFSSFKLEMNGPVFSKDINTGLVYVLPVIEIITAALLVYSATRFAGMILSFALMLAFTVYVGLAVSHAFNQMPCSCAGLFGFDWNEQLYFNVVGLIVTAAGIILTFREREGRKHGMDASVSHASLTT